MLQTVEIHGLEVSPSICSILVYRDEADRKNSYIFARHYRYKSRVSTRQYGNIYILNPKDLAKQNTSEE